MQKIEQVMLDLSVILPAPENPYFQKHDLLQRINMKHVTKINIIKHKYFLKVSGKMDCTIESSVFFYII